MEALGSPSGSPATMDRAMLSKYRKLVNASQVQQFYIIVRLPVIHFTVSGFFLQIFDRLCVFVFVSF